MDDSDRLGESRRRIDLLDDQILDLLNRRAREAQRIAQLKLGDQGTVFYRPEREAQILRRLRAGNGGPLPHAAIGRVFREIMSACLAAQYQLRIGFYDDGTGAGAAAARSHFGGAATLEPLPGLDSLITVVGEGRLDYGLLPEPGDRETIPAALSTVPVLVCGATMPTTGATPTRGYLILGRQQTQPTGDDLTALLFRLRRDAGPAVVGQALRESGLQTERSAQCFDSDGSILVFSVIAGHSLEQATARAIERLRGEDFSVQVLGAFPRGANEY